MINEEMVHQAIEQYKEQEDTGLGRTLETGLIPEPFRILANLEILYIYVNNIMETRFMRFQGIVIEMRAPDLLLVVHGITASNSVLTKVRKYARRNGFRFEWKK